MGGPGIESTKQIRAVHTAARIVIVTDYDDSRLRQAALAGACEYPFLSLGGPTMSHRASFFSTGTTRARAVLGAFLMYLSALPARSQQTSPPVQRPVNV